MAIRRLEPELAVGPPRDVESLLVYRAMMSPAEHREVGQRRRTPVCPVAEMMPLAEGLAAAREAAAPVPSVKRSPQGGRNRPGPGPDLHRVAMLIMAHHHPAGIARQAPGRFRGRNYAVDKAKTETLSCPQTV